MKDGEVVSEKKETKELDAPQQWSSEQAREKLDAFFQSNEFQYTYRAEPNTFFLKFKSGIDEFSSFDLQISIRQYQLVFSIVCYEDVPTTKINQISELIARINCYVILGHFNLYYSERLITHQNYLFFNDAYLNGEVIDSYIQRSVKLFETFQPIILKVIEKDEEPILALLDFEMNN